MTPVHYRFFNILIAATSGALMGLSMPGHNVGYLAWFALVPVLILIQLRPEVKPFRLLLPATIIWSWLAHGWFQDLFGAIIGSLLMIGVGFFFARVIHWGIVLSRHCRPILSLFALPLAWCSVEFLRYVLPYLEDIWFVLIAKSQWQQTDLLQILSITGFVGVSFLVVLSNTAITQLILTIWQRKAIHKPAIACLILIAGLAYWGQQQIPANVPATVNIAATVDLTNQDPSIQNLALKPMDGEGYWADTQVMSQAIFDVNAALTKTLPQPANFIVWPENEMATIDNPVIVSQLQALARQQNSYLVADLVWREGENQYDTAVMFDPEGNEVLRAPKIAITFREKQFGFTPGKAQDMKVVATPFGNVGLGVCFDRHRLWISRALKQHGADIILMPVDDDFKGNKQLPLLHATDSIFRAIENRVTYGLGTTSGVSMVINPYGQVTARSQFNQREVIQGTSSIHPESTFYSRNGDILAWLMCLLTLAIIIDTRRRFKLKGKD
ncbi:nitrilase-related carbon-nitrogen hydrolase [Motilimonas cestriensis]|uniref:nitrilase-related carbon-nitrogen hydrolase n=1 Tax=Motilimonas cestriensis TaxID=2742685 RepID=UPI003DA6C366